MTNKKRKKAVSFVVELIGEDDDFFYFGIPQGSKEVNISIGVM